MSKYLIKYHIFEYSAQENYGNPHSFFQIIFFPNVQILEKWLRFLTKCHFIELPHKKGICYNKCTMLTGDEHFENENAVVPGQCHPAAFCR